MKKKLTLGDALVQGMREIVAFERGELAATVRKVPLSARAVVVAPPAPLTREEIAARFW